MSTVRRVALILVLAAAAFGVAVPPVSAGGGMPACCVCDCAPAPSACLATGSPQGCYPFLTDCGVGLNATCRPNILNGTCAGVAACGGETAPAPTLGATGLTAFILLLAGYGALRLRRSMRRG